MRNTIRPPAGFRLIASAGLVGATLLLSACASTPEAPHAALAEARVAITTAEKDSAVQYASADLTEARQKLAQADNAVVSRQMVQADRLAHESRAAAELASARTEAAKAREVNDELRRSAEALEAELNRAGDSQ